MSKELDKIFAELKPTGEVLGHFEEVKQRIEKLINQSIANELRKIPQVDRALENYLWKRIDGLEGRP